MFSDAPLLPWLEVLLQDVPGAELLDAHTHIGSNDPDGDQLTYRWTTPTGQLANPADRQTLWTAPMQEGSVPVTITVADGKSGTATDTVTIQVIKPPVKEYTFEDVHFDFDRYSLRPEATRLLDEEGGRDYGRGFWRQQWLGLRRLIGAR